MTQPCIISVAPNGARRTASDHPRLPITPAELADCASDVAAAGASLLHLHVREADGSHSLDAGRYREALAAIRDAAGDRLILQVSTEAGGRYTVQQQMEIVDQLAPEAASFALRELCPTPREEPVARHFCQRMHECGVLMQYIVYEPQELLRLDALRRDGFFGEPRPFVLLVLGRYADGPEQLPAPLENFLGVLPEVDFPWSVCAFGRHEASAALAAAAAGGHVRVGFENNLWLANGQPAADNAALVRQLLPGLKSAGRRAATAAEARKILESG